MSQHLDLRQKPYGKIQTLLKAAKRSDLEAAVLNAHYNDWLEWCDDQEDCAIKCDKAVPYVGWIWRQVDFASGQVTIGRCPKFVGFMVKNKWGYPERLLTKVEFRQVMKYIDAGRDLFQTTGTPRIVALTFRELWRYMQTLKIPHTHAKRRPRATDTDDGVKGAGAQLRAIREIADA